MQLSRYHTGGFVIHRITIVGYAGHYSAWYDAEGKLLDAERFLGERVAAVSIKHTNLRNQLTKIGKRNVV